MTTEKNDKPIAAAPEGYLTLLEAATHVGSDIETIENARNFGHFKLSLANQDHLEIISILEYAKGEKAPRPQDRDSYVGKMKKQELAKITQIGKKFVSEQVALGKAKLRSEKDIPEPKVKGILRVATRSFSLPGFGVIQEGEIVPPIFFKLWQDQSHSEFTSFKEVTYDKLWRGDVVVVTTEKFKKLKAENSSLKQEINDLTY